MGKNRKTKNAEKVFTKERTVNFQHGIMLKTVSAMKKYFDTMPEARNWLANARYEEKHGIVVATP